MSSTPSHPQSSRNNSWTRFFESPKAWLLVILVLFAVPLYFSFSSPQPKLPPVLGKIQNFKLTNQDGRAVTYADEYAGSVLLVNFIFTSCPDVCPLLSKQMEKVQTRLITASPHIRLISITVDPDTDTPEVLKAYGEKFGARFRHWSFLTGDLMEIYDTVVNGFKVAMDNPGLSAEAAAQYKQDPKTLDSDDITYGLMDITHGEHFVVVDQIGQVRAYMKGNNNEDLNRIVHTLGLLVNTNPTKAPIL